MTDLKRLGILRSLSIRNKSTLESFQSDNFAPEEYFYVDTEAEACGSQICRGQ